MSALEDVPGQVASARVARRSGPLPRLTGLLLRHLYLLRSSWTRAFDLVYWPLLQMVIWGFITRSSPATRPG